jgi:hypothetical protein
VQGGHARDVATQERTMSEETMSTPMRLGCMLSVICYNRGSTGMLMVNWSEDDDDAPCPHDAGTRTVHTHRWDVRGMPPA